MVENNHTNFVDPKLDENHFLTKVDALARSDNISKVDYKLAVSMLKGGETFHGIVNINFTLQKVDEKSVFIDYKGKLVNSFVVNGQQVKDPTVFDSH